jgi:hypothetical protein
MKLEKLGPVGPKEFWSARAQLVRSVSNVLSFSETMNLLQNSDGIYSSSVSSDCFLCFGGRLRLSGMTRVAVGAIPDLRAARRASVPLSKIFFRFFIPASGRDFSGSRN